MTPSVFAEAIRQTYHLALPDPAANDRVIASDWATVTITHTTPRA